LAIKELEKEHTGYNITIFIYDVAKEYKIVDKLGYFVMDNAANNNTALEELDSLIHQNEGTGFDPIEKQLRCFDHILNLAVKDLLYGPKKKKGKRQNDLDDRDGPEIDEIPEHDDSDNENKRREMVRKAWRMLEAVGKAHNITL